MNKPMVTASKMTPVRIIAAQISLNEFKQELSSLPAYSAMPTLRLANAQRARLDLRVVPPKRAGVERNRSVEVILHNRCAVEFNAQRRRRLISGRKPLICPCDGPAVQTANVAVAKGL